ncbi:MAG TPA: GWxTD domain-containing protein [Bacteroidota bacterium]|nr:GWxTD domain-containing protein [Bacteroidota bacterium]
MRTSEHFAMRLAFATLAFAISFTDRASGQPEMRLLGGQSPTFFFDALCYASENTDRSRVDLYLQIPHEELRFVKNGNQFVARYDVTLSIYGQDQKLIQERTWSVDTRVEDFSQTTSNKMYSLTQRTFELEPGSYQLALQVQDQESKKTSRARRSLTVTDFKKEFVTLSDIMLVNRLSVEGERRSIVPNISGNVTQRGDGFFLFFEVYRRNSMDSVELGVKIQNAKREEIFQRKQVEPLPQQKTQSFVKVDQLNLPVGTYFITVEALPPTAAGAKPIAVATRTFNVRWTDIPQSISDIDNAIEQLRYVARPSEMDYMKEATDPEDRKRRFLEFWSKRDPDPSTPRNELMEEYYQRVDFTNKNFGHYLEGWRTDRGMVFIRFGQPDNIERRPFETNNKPYEIWYYYQLNREFIFVDESGFGDYRLRYPTTDLFGRIRD